MDCYDLHPDRVAIVLREVERQLRYHQRLVRRLLANGIDAGDTLFGHAREVVDVLGREARQLRRMAERHHVDGVEGNPSHWQDPKPIVQAQRGGRCGG